MFLLLKSAVENVHTAEELAASWLADSPVENLALVCNEQHAIVEHLNTNLEEVHSIISGERLSKPGYGVLMILHPETQAP